MRLLSRSAQPVRAVFSSPLLRVPALALGLTLLIELLNHRCLSVGFRSFFRFLAVHPWAFLVDFFLIALTLLFSLFWRRQRFSCLLLSCCWLTAGLINGYIQLKRSAPFTVPDMAELRAALDTLPNYMPAWGIVLLAIAAAALLAGLVLLFLRGPREQLPPERRLIRAIAATLAAGACLAGCWAMGFQTNQLSKTFMNLTSAYDSYGFSYCFLQTWLNRGVHRPASYSETKMEKIRDEVDMTPDSDAEDVNVIFIQLESLLDPQEVDGLSLSADAMPNLRSLKQTCSSGYLLVPVVGAGTANTEFEVLTGMSCRFFGPGEYPYEAKAQKVPIDSIAYDLRDLGYTAHAIHNNRATFYNRDEVFSNLGFDDFTSIEYMPETEKTPNGWATDEILTSQILQALDETEEARDFVYTITVQCHGSYGTTQLEDPAILVEACPDNIDQNAMEYYVNQLRETDAFVGELIAALTAREEKTVVVLYGDHLPSLGLNANQMESGSLFKTDYIIWDNLGLETKKQNLCAYQLSAEVLSRLEISGGFLSRFHQQRQESASYLSDLKAIQYDLLYGSDYLTPTIGVRNATNLQMGVTKATIRGLVRGDGYFYVLGENFTPYYHVSEGEKLLNTTYLSGELLRVDKDLDDTDQAALGLRVVDSHQEDLGEALYDFDY
ncbi:MAG: LTA synthase family protein [Oscillospiraceae bacterium]|nr:LTA synthase family protein [Oscillospiraceae bacterium]